MEQLIDTKMALNVFNYITEHGKKKGDKWLYHGIEGWASVDGYTVYLADENVTLSIGFHNKYTADFQSRVYLDQFVDKLKAISQHIN